MDDVLRARISSTMDWLYRTFLEYDKSKLVQPNPVNLLGMVLPVDQLVLICCFFASFFFSALYYRFMLPMQYFPSSHKRAASGKNHHRHREPFYKGRRFREAYISVIGATFMAVLFSWKAQLHIYFCIAFTYVVPYLLMTWKSMPLLTFLTLMAVLSVTHIFRQFSSFDIGTYTHFAMDHSGTIMMMIIKLCTFPYDIHDSYSLLKNKRVVCCDGAYDDGSAFGDADADCDADGESIISDNTNNSTTSSSSSSRSPRRSPRKHLETSLKKPSTTTSPYTLPDPEEKAKVLQRYPSPLEFAAYALFFPGVLVGPTMNFFEFRQFMSGELYKPLSNTASSSTDPGKIVAKLSRDRYVRFFKVLGISLFFCALHAAFRGRYPIPWLVGPAYQQLPWWQQILMTHLTILVERSKYYFVWGISEASYVLMGLGFKWNAKNGKIEQNGMENVNPLIIETSYDFRGLINAWNVCTSSWLHTYIYTRIRRKYKKENASSSRANLFTNVTSAFWHGFYPGYYLMFICAGFLTIVSRLFYKKTQWPFGENSKRVVCYLAIMIMCDYLFVPFMLLDWRPSLHYWKSMNYFGHWALGICLLFFVFSSKLGGGGKHHKHQK